MWQSYTSLEEQNPDCFDYYQCFYFLVHLIMIYNHQVSLWHCFGKTMAVIGLFAIFLNSSIYYAMNWDYFLHVVYSWLYLAVSQKSRTQMSPPPPCRGWQPLLVILVVSFAPLVLERCVCLRKSRTRTSTRRPKT